ncbi:MAG: VPLPA-CTERM sorting domain-containing protein [Pseudomonadota bacterium]
MNRYLGPILACVVFCASAASAATFYEIDLAINCSGGAGGSCNNFGGFNAREQSGEGNVVRMTGAIEVDQLGSGLNSTNITNWSITFTGAENGVGDAFTPENSGNPLAYNLTHAWVGGSGNGITLTATETEFVLSMSPGPANSTGIFAFRPHFDALAQFGLPGVLFQPTGDQFAAIVATGADGSATLSRNLNSVNTGISLNPALQGDSATEIVPDNQPSTIVLGRAIDDNPFGTVPLPASGFLLLAALGAFAIRRRG